MKSKKFAILKSFRPKLVITIKEKDIEMLKNELLINYEESKNLLMKHQGDIKKVIDSFLNDFK